MEDPGSLQVLLCDIVDVANGSLDNSSSPHKKYKQHIRNYGHLLSGF